MRSDDRAINPSPPHCCVDQQSKREISADERNHVQRRASPREVGKLPHNSLLCTRMQSKTASGHTKRSNKWPVFSFNGWLQPGSGVKRSTSWVPHHAGISLSADRGGSTHSGYLQYP